MDLTENKTKSLPLLAIGFGFSILFIGFYFRDLHREDAGTGGGKQIGVIENAISDVSRRPRSRLLWVAAQTGIPIFEKDTLKTGENSFARVTLKDLGSIELQPDSLAVLETGESGLKVNLASGDLFISGKVEAQVGKTMIVSVGNKGGVRIQKQAQTGEISVESQGAAQAKIVSSEGKIQEVKSGERLIQSQETSEIKVEVFQWQALSPTPGQVFKFKWDQPLKVAFQITRVDSTNPLPSLNRAIQVYSSGKKKKLLGQFPLSVDSTALEIPFEKPGKFFWRLVEGEKQSQLIALTSISILQEEAPKAGLDITKLAPKNLSLSLDPMDPEKSFLTGKNEDPQAVGIEILLGSQKFVIPKEQISPLGLWKLEIASGLIKNLKQGKIQARSLFPGAQMSSFSELSFDPSKFSLAEILKTPPQLISPSAGRNLSVSAIDKSGLKFTWDFEKNSFYRPKSFLVEIQSTDKGSTFKIQLESSANEILVTNIPPPGNYEWTVKALFEEGKVGVSAGMRKFSLISTKVRTPASFQRPNFVFEGDE